MTVFVEDEVIKSKAIKKDDDTNLEEYICYDCTPYRILKDDDAILNHGVTYVTHENIKPLSESDKVKIILYDKSDEYSKY